MLRGINITHVILDEYTPMSLIQVNYVQARACIEAAFRAQSVPYLKGSPGIGKSDIYQQIADAWKLKLIDVRLSQCEPTDLMGFPRLNADGNKAGYSPMEMFPIEGDEIPDGYIGWLLLLDEVNHAEPPTLKAAYKVVLDRMIGPVKLHKNVLVGMAGNLDTDNAITEEMGTAMQSRISPHLELEVNTEQWLAHANKAGIDYRITSFIDFRPDLLHHFEPDHTDCTYPCPRTWFKTHRYINNKSLDDDALKDIYMPLIAGTLGEGAAIEFTSFCHIFTKLPRMADIVASPDVVAFPDAPDVIYALSGMISHNVTEATLVPAMKFIARMDMDFQALTIRNIRTRHPTLTYHAEITKWLRTNASQLAA